MSPWEHILTQALRPQQSPWERLLADLLSSTALSGLRPESMLRSYQRYLADKIEELPALLGAAEMSLGKTGATLTGVRNALRKNPTWRAIIVAPLEVAKNTWPDEIGEWEHLQDLTYTVVCGTAEERKAALAVDADLTMINRENLQWLLKEIGGKTGWRWQILVYDESSRLKGFTKRTKGTEKTPPQLSEFGVLCNVRSMIKKVVELSGTPSPNGLYDLGGQARILFGQSSPLGENKHQFEQRFFDKNQYDFSIKPKPGAEEVIMEHLKPVMIGLRSEDYIDLPPRHFNPIYIKLPPKLMAQYKQFEADLYAEEYDVEAVNNGVLTNKLLQFCIEKDTEVLTQRGWVGIQLVTNKDKIWDGVEWVSCDGNIFKGMQPTVSCFGVRMTLNHKVLTVAGWKTAKEILYGDASVRFDRQKVRLPHGSVAAWDNGRADEEGYMDVRMPLREASGSHQPKPQTGGETSTDCDAELRMYARGDRSGRSGWPWDDRRAPMAHMDAHEEQVPQPGAQGLQELRRTGYRHAGLLVQGLPSILGRRAEGVCGRSDFGSSGQREELQQDELPVGLAQSAGPQHPCERHRGHPLGEDDTRGSVREIGDQVCDPVAATENAPLAGEPSVRSSAVEVYDLVNCGPRNRFVVRGSDGLLIVHNCNGGLYRTDDTGDPPKREVIFIHDLKLKALESIIAEAAGKPVLIAYSYKFDKVQIKKRFKDAVFFDEEPNFVKLWNAGKIKIGVSHPASIGHGLNLQHGGHIQAWYGLTWSLELWDQFNRRLARPGQAAPTVFIHVIMARGTEDERQYENLQTKGMTQDRITERVRVRAIPLAA